MLCVIEWSLLRQNTQGMRICTYLFIRRVNDIGNRVALRLDRQQSPRRFASRYEDSTTLSDPARAQYAVVSKKVAKMAYLAIGVRST